ncbi:NAD(P)-dependent oxidoreductase [Pseudochryseolinea flava]|uniref:NAD(P)-dependent oxidoreductase n=1 Tax=Pseudochryseolinea flava TaxID=2059302 RepID=A0A364Y3S7_9BACT|nr:NAD(P)-dependent oxidoreductase [Pseudochryseolinea flava]RAW00669.1 NAD(P)-dependent oxidoreductase [Pseudochryseolinea flava]
MSTSNIAFIGLGNMGHPMAKNLITAGFQLHLYNRTQGKVQKLGGENVQHFTSIEEAVQNVDVVVTMLSDDAAVKEVQVKMLPHLRQGAVHVSMSTISAATALLLEGSANHFGVDYIAAPVLGRPPAAAAKQLFILCAGNSMAKEKVQPVLSALSQRIFDYGVKPFTANIAKLLVNYQIFITTGMLSEVMLVAERNEIDKAALLEMMTSTVLGSPIVKNYGNMIVAEKDNPNGFATRLASKDLKLALDTADASNVQLPLGEIMQSHFKAMIDAGFGEQDLPMLISFLRERKAGRQS